MLGMMYYSFYQNHPEKEGFTSMDAGIQEIIASPEFKQEILEILHYLYQSLETMEIDNEFSFPCPLTVHSRYSTSQVLAALGYFYDPSFREGVKHFKDKDLDIFFTTLNKSEKDFSPSTLYDDYAINEHLFHWQTQSRVAEGSDVA